ncbi:MAG: hypothetical protein CFE43_17875 [Burkholderiales bacterium PBB3]|nr:MAG: hypothetical protein CFE43_17875 [Burkholderiales bacterium PBB3]
MNTSTASTSATSTAPSNPVRSAALNSLNLLSPQRFNTPIPVRNAGHKLQGAMEGTATKALIPSVEITVGTDPHVLVRRAVNTVSPGPLRNFLGSVMAARDVNRVLTLLPDDGFKFQRLPIDRLRSAAVSASLQSLQGPRARDTLYAAVVIAGIESLLGETVEPPYNSTDVIRSVVRDAMRTLDAKDSAQAHALRNCLGWGNDDEHFHSRSQSLQNQVLSAVQNLRNYQILSRHGRAM